MNTDYHGFYYKSDFLMWSLKEERLLMVQHNCKGNRDVFKSAL